jgi:hypothetical protein
MASVKQLEAPVTNLAQTIDTVNQAIYQGASADPIIGPLVKVAPPPPKISAITRQQSPLEHLGHLLNPQQLFPFLVPPQPQVSDTEIGEPPIKQKESELPKGEISEDIAVIWG